MDSESVLMVARREGYKGMGEEVRALNKIGSYRIAMGI